MHKRGGATGAIAPVDFQKGSIAPVNFKEEVNHKTDKGNLKLFSKLAGAMGPLPTSKSTGAIGPVKLPG